MLYKHYDIALIIIIDEYDIPIQQGYMKNFYDAANKNPWSVINYFNNECEPRAFSQSTDNNDIIGEIIVEADKEILDKLTSLVKGESFPAYVDTSVIYPQIKNNPWAIYSLLLVAGYLKTIKTSLSFNGDFMCEVALPNKEISTILLSAAKKLKLQLH